MIPVVVLTLVRVTLIDNSDDGYNDGDGDGDGDDKGTIGLQSQIKTSQHDADDDETEQRERFQRLFYLFQQVDWFTALSSSLQLYITTIIVKNHILKLFSSISYFSLSFRSNLFSRLVD